MEHENTSTFETVRIRIANTPELKEHADTILYDWPNWDEHIEWVASASVAEIVDWAETVEAQR